MPADADVGAGWRAGLAAGYDHTRMEVSSLSSSAGIDNYTLAAYAGTQRDGLGVRLGTSYTWSHIDATRRIAFAGFSAARHERWRCSDGIGRPRRGSRRKERWLRRGSSG